MHQQFITPRVACVIPQKPQNRWSLCVPRDSRPIVLDVAGAFVEKFIDRPIGSSGDNGLTPGTEDNCGA